LIEPLRLLGGSLKNFIAENALKAIIVIDHQNN
jgi:hypothetical protein